MWCIPQVDGEYVVRMENGLDLYAKAHDPKHPVVCLDESPTQLIGEVRQPIRAKPGKPRRYDYEHKRNGTVNLFVLLDAHLLAQSQSDRQPNCRRICRLDARPY
jgi:hypothetical protein